MSKKNDASEREKIERVGSSMIEMEDEIRKTIEENDGEENRKSLLKKIYSMIVAGMDRERKEFGDAIEKRMPNGSESTIVREKGC